MYGLIVAFEALEGEGVKLAQILDEAFDGLPGMLSHIVSCEPENPDRLWITEVWDSKESHEASLSTDKVQAAMTEGRPLIAAMGQRIETKPLAGIG